jgi:ATP-dependent Clp protease ATP-binding subunit ClpA
MFERFTQAARTAVIGAQSQARQRGHSQIGADDVLMAVLEDAEGPAARVLHDLGLDPTALSAEPPLGPSDAEALGSIGIDLDAVRRRAEQTFGPGALDRPRRQRPGLFGRRSVGGHLPFSSEAKTALELALREALAEGHRYIGSEHLFLGLLATEQETAMRVLRGLGITEPRVGLKRRVLSEIHRAA